MRFNTCPCCGGSKFSEFLRGKISAEHENQKLGDWREFFYGGRQFLGEVFECVDCQFQFLANPSEAAGKFYFDAEVDDYLALEGQRLNYFQRLRKQVVNTAPQAANTTFLADYGCGSGSWLSLWEQAQKRVGVEVNPEFLQRFEAMGIEGTDDTYSIPDNAQCILSAFDYLEHVTDPIGFLTEMKSKLENNDGMVLLGVPDMGKIASRLLGLRYYLYCPMHFNYFTKKSLHLLCQSVFPDHQINIFASPQMRTTVGGLAKWIMPNAKFGRFENMSIPVGYSASLVALIVPNNLVGKE